MNGKGLYLPVNIINEHLLNAGYMHGNSNKEDTAFSLEQCFKQKPLNSSV
jgi:hypothetical protein